jgi:hypothetical protein
MTEKETIEALYRSSRDRLQSLAQSILKSQDEATDAVGDMFAKLADGQLTLPAEKQESYLIVSWTVNADKRYPQPWPLQSVRKARNSELITIFPAKLRKMDKKSKFPAANLLDLTIIMYLCTPEWRV